MLFNSAGFLLFFGIVYLLYWFVCNRSLTAQNILLLVASYFFYAYWDWRFVFLLAFSTFLDYSTGLRIYGASTKSRKRMWLLISVVTNLCFLGFFKYCNFFIQSFADLTGLFGHRLDYGLLKIILPVGISFYTFHGLSYVFDIYYGRIRPTTNWVNYTLFVCFFPLLIAGPIERATHLLPQVGHKRHFSRASAVDGLRQILWGYIKKIVIADSCAHYANLIFNNYTDYHGSALLLGVFLFTIQIYGDFSGYSDIALGTARLLGFELLKNFSFPYFSRDIAEFWRRWHISLSSWFRDYLYIPLGGSKGPLWTRIRNVFIIFLVSGFWHGANWTFIVWGALNALLIVPSFLFHTNRAYLDTVAKGKLWPSLREAMQMCLTFLATMFAWIFFRSTSVSGAFHFIRRIFTKEILVIPFGRYSELKESVIILLLIVPFLWLEWLGRESNYAIEKLGFGWPRYVRWGFYMFLVFALGMFMETNESAFIYFQF
jgi:alginate O-acetyltransferase complex protein AlgI